MFKRDSGTKLFSFERPTKSVSASAPLPTQQYFPYENAWKEFDKLQKAARGGGPIRWVTWGLRILDGHRRNLWFSFNQRIKADNSYLLGYGCCPRDFLLV